MNIELSQLHPLLPRVEKPGRYVGGEFNETVKTPESVRARIALAFPDTYEIGISNHGFKILYELINAREEYAAERVYAPWLDFEAELRKAQLPLYSLENLTPLNEFDVIGFTLQAEVNYTNVLTMLDLGGLPLRAEERAAALPLVIAGGEGALAPEPMARFMDAFVLGDGEEIVFEILEAVTRFKSEGGRDKRELLSRISRIEGVYVPSHIEFDYEEDGKIRAIRKVNTECRTKAAKVESPRFQRRVYDLSRDPGPLRSIVPNLRAVHDRQVVEVRRGCARGCRFCHAGFTTRPVRERTLDQIQKAARKGLATTGHTDLSLLSLSTTDHSALGEVMKSLTKEFAPRNVAISLPSLRINSFDIKLAAEIQKVRKTGFTFAPEAGTARLRAVINKELDDETFYSVMRQVFERGWDTVKLYFMIGLPTETDADIEGIIATCLAAEKLGRQIRGNRININVTLSPFIPKPHTPFQWAAQIPSDEMKRRFFMVRDGAKRSKKIDVKFAHFDGALLEAALARGDRRMGEAIERAWRLGVRFDGWSEQFKFALWKQAFDEAGLDIARYAQRERGLDEILSWDHIDVGIAKEFLRKDWEAALAGQTVPDCANGPCAGCGVCQIYGPHQLVSSSRFSVSGSKDSVSASQFPVSGSQPQPANKDATEVDDDDQLTTGNRKPETENRIPGAENRKPGTENPLPLARLRLFFSKTGRLRYISHLDLQEVLISVTTRAGLPVAYSGGYHPHPLMTLPPPLPLGFDADEEPLEISLTAAVDGKTALKALNKGCPEGLKFVSAQPIPINAPSITAQAVAADYVIQFPEELIPSEEAKAAIKKFNATAQWIIEKETKTTTRAIDLKTSVHIGEQRAGKIQMLVSLAEGKYVEPLRVLSEILGRTVSLAGGVMVTRRRIIS